MDMYPGPLQNCRDLEYALDNQYKVVLGHFWKDDQSPRSVHLTVEQIKRFNDKCAADCAFGCIVPVGTSKDRSVHAELKDVAFWVKGIETRRVQVNQDDPEQGYYQEVVGTIKVAPTVFGHLLNDLLRSNRKIAFGLRGPCDIVHIGEAQLPILEVKDIIGWDIVEIQDN